MARNFRPYSPDQPFLLPPSPSDWLSPDHLAYAVRDLVAELDLRAVEAGYSRDGRGAPAYHPRLMVSLLIYAWCSSVVSSRKIARLCTDDLGGRLLAAGQHPDFRSISDFRLQHREALRGFFVQSLRLCQRAGMVSLGHVAVDGTKIAANASKHKAMSYGRMGPKEEDLAKQVDRLLELAAQADAAEDAEYGADNAGSWLPAELINRQSRLRKLREAKAALEAEAQAAAKKEKDLHEQRERERQERGEPPSRRKPPPDPDTVLPKPSAQRNFTDPDSRMMKASDGAWVQGYNAQITVDTQSQVIVAAALSNEAADIVHLAEQTEQTIRNTGAIPKTLLADAGYFSGDAIHYLEFRGIEPIIPPDRQRHGQPAEPVPALAPEELAALKPTERQRHVLATEQGRRTYAKRKSSVEPIFGQMKGCPGAPGLRSFLRRGLRKCAEEWLWVCAAHNFKKYMRYRRAQAVAGAT